MSTMTVRTPAVAGLFYPASAPSLRSQAQQMLDAAPAPAVQDICALIAPHAGYIYSGPIAASAFKSLAAIISDRPRTVFLLGPAHRVPFDGVAISQYDAFATPLGRIPLAHDWAAHLLAQGAPFCTFEPAHEGEHSLEVELPFLQLVLPHARIVPLLFGDVNPHAVVPALCEALRQAGDALLIVSTDLSHYHAYQEAVTRDHALLAALLAGDQAGVRRQQACGLLPLLALMEIARRLHWRPHLLDYRNSGDTAGDRRTVVGYAAVAYTPAQD